MLGAWVPGPADVPEPGAGEVPGLDGAESLGVGVGVGVSVGVGDVVPGEVLLG